MKLIDTLFKHLEDRGIHAHDRGGNRGVIYEKYLGKEKPQRFVIRLKDRDLVHRGRRRNCWDLAKVVPTPYETVLIVYEEGKERKRRVQYNALEELKQMDEARVSMDWFRFRKPELYKIISNKKNGKGGDD